MLGRLAPITFVSRQLVLLLGLLHFLAPLLWILFQHIFQSTLLLQRLPALSLLLLSRMLQRTMLFANLRQRGYLLPIFLRRACGRLTISYRVVTTPTFLCLVDILCVCTCLVWSLSSVDLRVLAVGVYTWRQDSRLRILLSTSLVLFA